MPYTILIVDDNKLIRTLLGDIIGKAGYTVVSAESAESALATIIDITPDLMIIDYHMDGINGAKLIRIIRQTSKYAETPILGLSGLKGSETELMDAGATAYIAKPIKDEPIVQSLQKFLL